MIVGHLFNDPSTLWDLSRAHSCFWHAASTHLHSNLRLFDLDYEFFDGGHESWRRRHRGCERFVRSIELHGMGDRELRMCVCRLYALLDCFPRCIDIWCMRVNFVFCDGYPSLADDIDRYPAASRALSWTATSSYTDPTSAQPFDAILRCFPGVHSFSMYHPYPRWSEGPGAAMDVATTSVEHLRIGPIDKLRLRICARVLKSTTSSLRTVHLYFDPGSHGEWSLPWSQHPFEF